LAIILDQGRGAVYPVNAKRLKIPISNKGRAGGGEFGIDFIFAKSAKAVKATYFLTNAIEKHGKMIADMMIKTIQRVHNG